MKFKYLINVIGLAILLVHVSASAAEISPKIKELLNSLGIPQENVRQTPVDGQYAEYGDP